TRRLFYENLRCRNLLKIRMIAATTASRSLGSAAPQAPHANIGAILVGSRACDVNCGRGMRQRNLHHEVNSLTIEDGVYHDDEMRPALEVETRWPRSRVDALGFV